MYCVQGNGPFWWSLDLTMLGVHIPLTTTNSCFSLSLLRKLVACIRSLYFLSLDFFHFSLPLPHRPKLHDCIRTLGCFVTGYIYSLLKHVCLLSIIHPVWLYALMMSREPGESDHKTMEHNDNGEHISRYKHYIRLSVVFRVKTSPNPVHCGSIYQTNGVAIFH